MLAERIADHFVDRETLVIQIDSYYIDLSHLPFEERAQHNFDTPDAIDFDLLVEQLRLLIAGGEITIPAYRFDTHTRASKNEWIQCSIGAGEGKRPVVIIEGLHTFCREDLHNLIDLKIFIEADEAICLSRRLERDTRERGRPHESVLDQFEKTVLPMYEEYILPTKQFADLVLDGGLPMEETAQRVIELVVLDLD